MTLHEIGPLVRFVPVSQDAIDDHNQQLTTAKDVLKTLFASYGITYNAYGEAEYNGFNYRDWEREIMSYGHKPAEGENLTGKYIVWGTESTLPPRMVYETRPEAIRVSILMANKHHGEEFYVAKLVGFSGAVTPKVQYTGERDD